MPFACLSLFKENTVKAFTALTLSLPLTVLAQETDQHVYEGFEQDGSQWSVGVAAFSNQKAYTNSARDSELFPFLSYENEYINWFGPELDFKLHSIKISNTQEINFSISVGYDFGAYDKDDIKDTPILSGMDERDGVVEAGAEMEWKSSWVDISAKWMTDVSGDRKGNHFSLGFERSWMFGQHIMLSKHVEVIWLDDKYVDYHYGVRDHEVCSPSYGITQMPFACLSLFKENTVKTFTALSLSLPLTVLAQETDQHVYEGFEQDGSQWSVGVAAFSNQKAYTDSARDSELFPFLSYENEYINWFGPEIDFKLPGIKISNTQEINFSISVGYDFGAYDKDDIKDTPILSGMDERDGVVEAGAEMEWKSSWVDIRAKWMTDVSGDRKGNNFSLGFERSWTFGENIMLSQHVEVIWLDDNYVDYHYGVRDHEARTDRPGYIGESTVNFEYGISGAYLFDQNHSILVDVGFTALGNEIKNSPLVDSSSENSILFVYMYSF